MRVSLITNKKVEEFNNAITNMQIDDAIEETKLQAELTRMTGEANASGLRAIGTASLLKSIGISWRNGRWSIIVNENSTIHSKNSALRMKCLVKRFNVRKNAEPFVREELAKGEVAAALFDTAGEFAIQRREMIASQQFNEAALRIEEEVAKATNELSKSRDYGNVLDGKNLWGQRMDRIRSEIITTVQMPSLQKKLRHEFDLNEITNRFKLKSVIDKKIIAAEQLSLNSLSTNLVEKLSNLAFKIKITIWFSKVVNKYAPGIKSGRFNGDEVISSLGALKKDIAEDVVAQYVGRDPSRAVDLIIALEDAYDNKTEDLQELQAGGDYTMHTLLNIGSDDANDILERA